jgi:hypothetical protein
LPGTRPDPLPLVAQVTLPSGDRTARHFVSLTASRPSRFPASARCVPGILSISALLQPLGLPARILVLEIGDAFVAEKPRVRLAKLGGTDWDLSPDGKRGAVVTAEGTAEAPKQGHEIVMLQNFFDETTAQSAGGENSVTGCKRKKKPSGRPVVHSLLGAPVGRNP